ncbi:MAG: hypothetical protein KI790_16795 [Cyclobacteriaceae bacterium]|nr:hypothetical protein [Cyclobacteriaceae bacterium HetDA_MAG_MS6]
MMKKSLFYCALISLIWSSACNNDNCDDDFVSCPNGPVYGDFRVQVTINDDNPVVDVILFRGRIEDQDTLLQEAFDEEVRTFSLEMDKYYSGLAFYRHEGADRFPVLNGKNFNSATDDCGCDESRSSSLDLKLAR